MTDVRGVVFPYIIRMGAIFVIDRLTHMLENREYQKCVDLAEQQLVQGGYSLHEFAHINLIICRCRIGLHDHHGAIPSGLLATKLAKDLNEWEMLGRALVNVGNAYAGVGEYDQALHHLYGYFDYLARYSSSRHLEGAVWKYIGIVHQRKLESAKAIEALDRARAWFMAQGIEHSAFTCTNDLVNIYLQKRNSNKSEYNERIQNLLRYEKMIAKKYFSDIYYQCTYLNDLSASYLHNLRFGRAIVCAQKVLDILLETRSDNYWLAFHALMLLHRCRLALGNSSQALGYALAAHMEAKKGNHVELEYLATQAMIKVIRMQDMRSIQALDREYQAIGIDLGQHLDATLLRREH